MQTRDIVVIGGSAGSLESLEQIVSTLPPGFPASIFVVIHLSADFPSTLHERISRPGLLPATEAVDGEPIRHGHIYMARPDYHLEIASGRVRVLRGPRENRHRPAIDPLFRSAAREFGTRVVGIILSGFHDDGATGLYAVRQRGGIAIVQDPRDASSPEMPASAIRYANPHYVLRINEIAAQLVQLARPTPAQVAMPNKKKSSRKGSIHKISRKTSRRDQPQANLKAAYNDEGEGTPSVFACPECHGVLWELKNGKIVRFRCRVGHSYSQDSLASELSQSCEAALWAAMRALEEKAALQRRVADSLSQGHASARRLRDQSSADEVSARVIREMILGRDAKLQPPGTIQKSKGDESEVA